MKLRLPEAAAKRLDTHRRLQSEPLAAAQKALWEALLRGDMTEASRQSGIVQSIRGPQPPSPLALKLIERFDRLAADHPLCHEALWRRLRTPWRAVALQSRLTFCDSSTLEGLRW